MTDHHHQRRLSAAASAASLASPIPPAPPLPQAGLSARIANRISQGLTRSWSTHVSRDGAGRASYASYLPSNASQDAIFKAGDHYDLTSLAISADRTRAILAGRDMLQVISVVQATCTEQYNLRADILAHNQSALNGIGVAARNRETLDIRDVAWGNGGYDACIATAVGTRIVLYDLKYPGHQVANLVGHRRQVHRLAFSPHGEYLLLSGSQDGAARLWDLRNLTRPALEGVDRKMYQGLADGVRDVAWCPTDASVFAFGTDNGSIQRWDYRNAKAPLSKVSAHEKTCMAIDWHPDGQHLLSASTDRTVKVWDVGPEGRRHPRPVYTLSTPYPVLNARWRPECEVVCHPSHGSSSSSAGIKLQCTQIVTSYDRDHASVHLWDLRRPYLPFREMWRHAQSPTRLLWHSQDLLWSVGKGGIFAQTDVKYAPKVLDRRNWQAIAIAPNGALTAFSQKRPRPQGLAAAAAAAASVHFGGSNSTSASNTAVAGTVGATGVSFSIYQDGEPGSRASPEEAVSELLNARNSLDDAQDDHFLSSSFDDERHQRRSPSNRSVRLSGTTPPVAPGVSSSPMNSGAGSAAGGSSGNAVVTGTGKKKTFVPLGEAVASSTKASFRPHQAAFRGEVPGGVDVQAFEYLARKYQARALPTTTISSTSTDPSNSLTMSSGSLNPNNRTAISSSNSNKPVSVRDVEHVAAGFEKNAQYAQRTSAYQTAQTFRVAGLLAASVLRARADESMRRRLGGSPHALQLVESDLKDVSSGKQPPPWGGLPEERHQAQTQTQTQAGQRKDHDQHDDHHRRQHDWQQPATGMQQQRPASSQRQRLKTGPSAGQQQGMRVPGAVVATAPATSGHSSESPGTTTTTETSTRSGGHLHLQPSAAATDAASSFSSSSSFSPPAANHPLPGLTSAAVSTPPNPARRALLGADPLPRPLSPSTTQQHPTAAHHQQQLQQHPLQQIPTPQPQALFESSSNVPTPVARPRRSDQPPAGLPDIDHDADPILLPPSLVQHNTTTTTGTAAAANHGNSRILSANHTLGPQPPHTPRRLPLDILSASAALGTTPNAYRSEPDLSERMAIAASWRAQPREPLTLEPPGYSPHVTAVGAGGSSVTATALGGVVGTGAAAGGAGTGVLGRPSAPERHNSDESFAIQFSTSDGSRGVSLSGSFASRLSAEPELAEETDREIHSWEESPGSAADLFRAVDSIEGSVHEFDDPLPSSFGGRRGGAGTLLDKQSLPNHRSKSAQDDDEPASPRTGGSHIAAEPIPAPPRFPLVSDPFYEPNPFISTSSESSALKSSHPSRTHEFMENLEASGTIVPDISIVDINPGTANGAGAVNGAAASLREQSSSAPAALGSEQSSQSAELLVSDYLTQDPTINTELNNPFSMLSFLEHVLQYYTGDAQAASFLLLLLIPLLPPTYPLPSATVQATLSNYSAALASLPLTPAQTAQVIDIELPALMRKGINPLQAEAVLATYHDELMALELHHAAAQLRTLAFPAFPAVYEQAVKDTSVGLMCLKCKNPINNPLNRMLCETCGNRQDDCPICWMRISPFPADPRKKATGKKGSVGGFSSIHVGERSRLSSLVMPTVVVEGLAANETRQQGNLLLGGDNNSYDPTPEDPTPSSQLPILWLTCPLCNHGGHANCMKQWFSTAPINPTTAAATASSSTPQSSSSPATSLPAFLAAEPSGACPTPDCPCACGPGLRRLELAQLAERAWQDRLIDRAGRVRGDTWRVGESRAVRRAREGLGSGADPAAVAAAVAGGAYVPGVVASAGAALLEAERDGPLAAATAAAMAAAAHVAATAPAEAPAAGLQMPGGASSGSSSTNLNAAMGATAARDAPALGRRVRFPNEGDVTGTGGKKKEKEREYIMGN